MIVSNGYQIKPPTLYFLLVVYNTPIHTTLTVLNLLNVYYLRPNDKFSSYHYVVLNFCLL